VGATTRLEEAQVEETGGTSGGSGRRDPVKELQTRIEAAIDEVRPKIRKALEELDARVDEAVNEIRPKAQNAMDEVRPKVDQFVADVQPRLDSMLSRLQQKIDELRRDLDSRASRTSRAPAGQIAEGGTEPGPGSDETIP
jgi:ElaB/YqjD/DUF883 family membrane-anchored ribosome-binding protein